MTLNLTVYSFSASSIIVFEASYRWILYDELDFTNALDGKRYRTPDPCDSRQYYVAGLNAVGKNSRFQYDEMTKEQFQRNSPNT